MSQPWCEVQPRVATPRCEVQPLGSTPCCNSMTAPHAYTLLFCWGESACVNRGVTTGLKPELQLHSPPNRCVLSSVACAWFGLLPKGCRSRVRSQGTNLTSHVRHRAPRVASRIALCTRPPTTHIRGALGHTSWIRPTCKRTIGLSPQFSRQGAGRVSARASARAPSNATDQRSEIIDSHHGRAATSSAIV